MLHVYRHPDRVDPPSISGALRLDADATWVVEGTKAEVDAVFDDLGAAVCDRVTDCLLLLRFGNSVGHIHRAGSLGALVVTSGKWTESDYDQLLEDISRVTAALPFAPATPSSLPYERTELDTSDVLYHAFVWLRHTLLRDHDTRLGDAIQGILRDPHRRLVRTTRNVPTELAARFGAGALIDIAAGRWPLADRRLGFEVGDRRVLPLRVDEDQARESVDTAENRFVKSFLDECSWVVDRVRHQLGVGDGTLAKQVQLDCDRLTEILGVWRSATVWAEVGIMTHFPASSSVLQRRYEYRTVLRQHMMLRLGSRVPLDPGTSRRLLESKDIATLYELWATFAIVDEVTTLLGPPVDCARVVVNHTFAFVSWGLVAAWPNGTALAYNHTYSRSGGFHGRSRSLRLRPDIALFIPTGLNMGLHLFDAKFRLDGALVAEGEDDVSTYKRTDLHKMHAYRDAIPSARAAWVVYPGEEDTAFFDDGRFGLAALDAGPVAGVGALSLLPDGDPGGLRAVIKAILPGSASR